MSETPFLDIYLGVHRSGVALKVFRTEGDRFNFWAQLIDIDHNRLVLQASGESIFAALRELDAALERNGED